MDTCINLLSDKLYFTGTRIDNPHHVVIPTGIVAVIGANGAGKTTLGRVLEKGWNFRTNRLSSPMGRPRVRTLEFSDIHSLGALGVEYYQQRYEAAMNDDVLTVADAFGPAVGSERWQSLALLFGLPDVADRKINFLSSGELRKTLIINAIVEPTDVLVLDNPYIGLDAASRRSLDEAIASLADSGITVIMLVANPDDIHPRTNCVIPMRSMQLLEPIAVGESLRAFRARLDALFDYAVNLDAIPLPPTRDTAPLDSVLRLEGCDVTYGSRTIIRDIDWEVADCSFWALMGPNGAGKSTLLSLICADNPQAYRNNITLFGRRRGSGESIWDIKRRIAYISPEMSHHFHADAPITTIIAQGLNDTSGTFITPKPNQIELARRWISILHLESIADRPFNTLSSGEQRMVLLARTFIKQPRLMILDEPMHGLDMARSRAVRAIINHFAARAVTYPKRYPMSIIFVSHYASEMPECLTYTKTLAAPR